MPEHKLRAAIEDFIHAHSTCALADEENDFLIEKLIKKYKERVRLEDKLDSLGPISPEKTRYGFRFLPDKADGAGPIYFSLIQKN